MYDQPCSGRPLAGGEKDCSQCPMGDDYFGEFCACADGSEPPCSGSTPRCLPCSSNAQYVQFIASIGDVREALSAARGCTAPGAAGCSINSKFEDPGTTRGCHYLVTVNTSTITLRMTYQRKFDAENLAPMNCQGTSSQYISPQDGYACDGDTTSTTVGCGEQSRYAKFPQIRPRYVCGYR